MNRKTARWVRRLAALLTAVLTVLIGSAQAGAEIHRQRARLYCRLPFYDYAEDHDRVAKSMIAAADAPEPANWFEPRAPGTEKPGEHVVKWTVRRKRFHFPARSLTVDHVKLEQIGLALYDAGVLQCSGRITHSGGRDGSLQSSCVVLRLRAYAAPPQTVVPLADAPVVWESSEQRVRVRRGQPVFTSLVSDREANCPTLGAHFEDITHLEVELRVQRDR